ncbi:hypothetical protein Xoosp13_254 [Xanthomonas phage Xoo-sp13]|nr:hypothetical protein Xoosp13_254 [Xanthomonas phage Xoo-sp13]
MEIFAKILLQVGWPGLVAFILLCLGGTAAMQWIKQINFKKIAERSGIRVGNETELRYHTVFSTAQYRLAFEIPNLEVFPEAPVRQRIVIDLLRIYITAILDGCKDIAATEMKSWSAEQWTIEITNRLSAMVSTATANSRMEGIPDVVITKFSRWIHPFIDMLFNQVETIGKTSIYSSNIARTNTLLLMINLLMTTILGDAERSIRSLNGDITGKMYKGQLIEPVDH